MTDGVNRKADGKPSDRVRVRAGEVARILAEATGEPPSSTNPLGQFTPFKVALLTLSAVAGVDAIMEELDREAARRAVFEKRVLDALGLGHVTWPTEPPESD